MNDELRLCVIVILMMKVHTRKNPPVRRQEDYVD